jgi:hypothetical protein
MAVPTNTVSAHSAIGNREDLAEAIYDISPMDTPFLSSIDRVTATAVTHEWQTDALDAAATNRQIEGDDTTANTFAATTRVNNKLQISKKAVSVSGTQRAVNSAGRADEFSYQLAKRGREIKRDMELALTQNQASSGGGAGTARSCGSLESWLSTNKTSLGTGTAQTTAGFASGDVTAPVDSTVQGTFTKAGLDAVIQAAWNAGGDVDTIMVGPFNRTKVSGFSGISTLQTDANATGDVTLMGAVDFYKSNFGTLKVVPNRFQRDRTAFVLDTEFFAVATLRDMEVEALAKTGDTDKSQLVTEFTLEVRNEASSGKVTDLTTA